jgi:Galactose oxidase, central domain
MRPLVCALSAWVLAACGAPVLAIHIAVSTKACDGALALDPARDPVAGVDTLRFTLSGDKLATLTQTARFSDGGLSLPNLPLGTNRRVVVEALQGNALRARGDSGPFDVQGGHDVGITVFLRVVDAFTLTGQGGGGACTRMSAPRVGHALTLLPDGRVLITGGFSLDAARQLHYQSAAEVYDPQTGTFSPFGSSPAYARAGHAALAITSSTATGVLLGGGEGPGGSGAAAVRPFELFAGGGWQPLQPASTSASREHQMAVVDVKTGYAVFAGGLPGPATTPLPSALDSVTYFDFSKGALIDVDEPLAAALFDAAIVSRSNLAPGGQAQGGFVLLGGRTALGEASNQISGMVFDEGQRRYTRDKLWEQAPLSVLPAPRVRHFAARLSDDSIAVLGGLTKAGIDNDYAGATDAITLVRPAASSVADLAARLTLARADGCGIALEGGALLYAGGGYKDGSGQNRSASAAEIVSPGSDMPVRALQGPGSSVAGWGLQNPRHRAACVRLKDGSVLVTGGYQFAADGSVSVLDSAEIYVPPAN